MGEAKQGDRVSQERVVEVLGLETATAGALGRQRTGHSTWADAFFIEFLTITSLFDQWVADCPLDYKSPNGSSRRDILGTSLLFYSLRPLALCARECDPPRWGQS